MGATIHTVGNSHPDEEATMAEAGPSGPHGAASDRHPVGLVTCPNCGKKLRWPYRLSGEAICPACRLRLVILSEPWGQWSAQIENEDSLTEMICDWLDPDEEDDKEADEDSD